MSDLLLHVRQQGRALDQAIVGERPGIRLPYAQRILNPFPLASSGSAAGDFPQSRTVVILAALISVYVATTNNGSNYWTIDVKDLSGTTVASVTTAAIAANVGARLAAASITQPVAGNALIFVQATATGSPGSIYIVPELIVA